ncbi:hypothetical protein Nepgr_001381 [Nepenthes gracilis]|uniref:Alpha/beta hydrolase fold-3 domain-containing protein n=1 Tax=Nepenthes gracilis TaxID=150966 RepID=A0AAD3P8F5_NEPGR|nr:hypothetical protein Nepgr_001381 [Nepenthes gracilis]
MQNSGYSSLVLSSSFSSSLSSYPLFLLHGKMANSEETSTGNSQWDTILELFDVKAPAASTPVNGVVSSDITIDTSRNLWFRLYVPTVSEAGASTTLPVIVYFHGGGFMFWSPDLKPYDDLCRRIAGALSAVVVSVNYRLAPEHQYPAPYDDGFETLKFLDSKKVEGFPANTDIEKCFLAGDSAGGNLAHHVAVIAGDYDFQALKILGLILIQPFFGAEERTESELRLESDPMMPMERTDWAWKQFLPDGSDRDHPAANVFGPRSKDISGVMFPATLIVVGGLDPLQDLSRRYYEWLIISGKEAKMVEYPNAPHLFYAFLELLEFSMAISEIKGFVRKLLTK